MQKKIKYLTQAAVVAILLLVVIQINFLRNTQRLYEKQTITEIKEELASIEKDLNIDSIRKSLCTNAVNMAASEPNKNKLITALRNSYDDELTGLIRKRIGSNTRLKKEGVDYFVQITQLAVNFAKDPSNPVVLSNLKWIGNESSDKPLYFANNNISRSSEKGAVNPVYIEYDTLTSFESNNLKNTVFKKLAGLIFFFLFIFGCVVWLFYQSIKNILLQKKIADIKTDFVNNITHEFKTPLTNLDIATATLKKKGMALDNELQEIIDTIERQSKRLYTLTKQAIEFSKSDAEISINKKETDINLLMGTIMADFQKLHPDVRTSVSESGNGKNILTDAELLTTAINNILNNAVRYGGTSINTEVVFNDRNCLIAIKDNGIGMAKEKLKYIFDKFYRIESGDVHNTKGLGLGLYYAREVARAHGGNITIESVPGQGSVFTISIPVA